MIVTRDTPCAWTGAPCVVVRSAAAVRLALATGHPFTPLSARAAASGAGVLAWQALAAIAREGPVAVDILDCADASGRALEALRLGQSVLVLDAAAVGHADVVARAAALGATVLPARPPAFDPGPLPAPDGHGLARLAAFLSPGAPSS